MAFNFLKRFGGGKRKRNLQNSSGYQEDMIELNSYPSNPNRQGQSAFLAECEECFEVLPDNPSCSSEKIEKTQYRREPFRPIPSGDSSSRANLVENAAEEESFQLLPPALTNEQLRMAIFGNDYTMTEEEFIFTRRLSDDFDYETYLQQRQSTLREEANSEIFYQPLKPSPDVGICGFCCYSGK